MHSGDDERTVRRAEITVSSVLGTQVRVKGLSLEQLGYGRGARVSVRHRADTSLPAWDFIVDNNETSTMSSRNPPPPSWITSGAPLVIEVSGVTGAVPPAPRVRSTKASRGNDSLPSVTLRPALTELPAIESALCIGVDVTWWGGSSGKPATQTETIAWALRASSGAWGEYGLRRVDLAPAAVVAPDDCTANADPDGSLLASEISRVIAEHGSSASRIVFALDAPLVAADRPSLGRRARVYPDVAADGGDDQALAEKAVHLVKKGVLAFRQADEACQASVQASRKHWRNIYLQPGAPEPPRIRSLARALGAAGFELYRTPDAPLPKRVLVECFPNEAFWAADVVTGRYAGMTFDQARSYKRLDDCTRVWPAIALAKLTEHYVDPVAEAAGLKSEERNALLASLWAWLSADRLVHPDGSGAMHVGKPYDDALDSVLSLLCAVALANGCAHVHVGDSADGHIVGPGLSQT